MNLLKRLRRIDDAVLARLGFIDRPLRFAAGGFIPGPQKVLIGPHEHLIPASLLAEQRRLISRMPTAKQQGEALRRAFDDMMERGARTDPAES